MEVRTAASPKDVKHYTTDRLREEFLIQDLFQADKINLVYSHIDRIITGAAVPVNEKLVLTAGDELRAEYFLQRRELGIINIGGDGIITIDGRVYEVNARDGMYVGRGSKDISFESTGTRILPDSTYQTGGRGRRRRCDRKRREQSRTWNTGRFQPQNHQQIYRNRTGRELSAGNGTDKTSSGKRMEHNAVSYT